MCMCLVLNKLMIIIKNTDRFDRVSEKQELRRRELTQLITKE